MQTYVALQLGINVGKRQVKMVALKALLEKAGYKNVRTLLASGNVIFEAEEVSIKSLTDQLNVLMTKHFGFEIKNIVRKHNEIQKLVASEPFKSIYITPETRLYVTFLSENPSTTLKIPYTTPKKDYKILTITDTEVVSVKMLSEKSGTVDAMSILKKEFGREITTRNWNTIVKIANL